MDEILGDIRYAGVLSRRLLLRSFSFGGRSFIIQSDLKGPMDEMEGVRIALKLHRSMLMIH